MTTDNRDDLSQGVRDLFDAPPGAVERVVEGALARPAPSGTARRLSIVAAVLALTGAAVALWRHPLPAPYLEPGVEVRVFPVGDLTVAVEEDGTSWIVGPGSTSTDNDHFDLIIVEEREP